MVGHSSITFRGCFLRPIDRIDFFVLSLSEGEEPEKDGVWVSTMTLSLPLRATTVPPSFAASNAASTCASRPTRALKWSEVKWSEKQGEWWEMKFQRRKERKPLESKLKGVVLLSQTEHSTSKRRRHLSKHIYLVEWWDPTGTCHPT